MSEWLARILRGVARAVVLVPTRPDFTPDAVLARALERHGEILSCDPPVV